MSVPLDERQLAEVTGVIGNRMSCLAPAMLRPALFAVFGLALLLAVAPRPVLAVEPDEILADKVLEHRAREISSGLRCLVCQNQSIDDSNAPLAKDLRIIVRERLTAGDSDAAVRSFVVARYGEFVLLRPPVSRATLLLWLAPLLLLATAVVLASRHFLGRKVGADGASARDSAPLDAEEQRRLSQILGRSD